MEPRTGPVGNPELLVEIDHASPLPLHEQLERTLRADIRGGRLPAGTRLPSTRRLASELGLSRGVVSEAYGQLAAEGYIETRQGAAVRVAQAVRGATSREPTRPLAPSYPYDFDPGLPDLAGFPRDRWLHSLRVALRESPTDAAGYGDPRGAPRLREALAEHLARSRGVAADPENALICSGFRQGFSILCRWLRAQGVEAVAMEDPGWHVARLIVEHQGLRIIPVPVDEDGLRVDELAATDAQVVLVAPAHQYPTGAVLSRERRAQLIDWAERGERLIVEDDFDSELRYEGAAVGALQGLAPERVLYIGSASKRLLPGMRLGWLLIPSWLAWPLISSKAIEDGGSEALGQLALADFIARGELDRHIRRMRLRYRDRRDALLRALERSLPQATASGAPAGLFELVLLPAEVNERRLLDAAATHGVSLEGLALHRFDPGGPPGLVLGYGNLAEPAIERGVRLIAEAVDGL
jgi:GntR family transcriptional regulator/MocR family aminotransferase